MMPALGENSEVSSNNRHIQWDETDLVRINITGKYLYRKIEDNKLALKDRFPSYHFLTLNSSRISFPSCTVIQYLQWNPVSGLRQRANTTTFLWSKQTINSFLSEMWIGQTDAVVRFSVRFSILFFFLEFNAKNTFC